MPLVSYIRNSLRFGIMLSLVPGVMLPLVPGVMPPLVPVVKILKKKRGHRENLGESGGQTFKGSDREKCQF